MKKKNEDILGTERYGRRGHFDPMLRVIVTRPKNHGLHFPIHF